ncbi:MAG: hypothetical protein IJ340_07150 [Odoribacter sp.]|nr:hypothetical protein [Odoribacter sp.]
MHYSEKIICTRPGKRPSETSVARNAIIERITHEYSMLKGIRVKDRKWYFIFRARYGKRSLCAKAYSLERLITYIKLDIQRKVFAQA